MLIVRMSFYIALFQWAHQLKSVGSISFNLCGEGLAHLFINLPKAETWFLNTDFLHGCIYCVRYIFCL